MQKIARGRLSGGVPARWSSHAAQEIARETLIAIGLDWSERGESIRKATVIQSNSEAAARRLAEHVVRNSYLVDPDKHAEMQAFARQHKVACPPRMTEEEIAEFVESSWRDFIHMATA